MMPDSGFHSPKKMGCEIKNLQAVDSKFRIPKSELCLAIFVPRLRGFQTPDSTHASWFPAIYFGGSRRPTPLVPAVLAAIFRTYFGGYTHL